MLRAAMRPIAATGLMTAAILVACTPVQAAPGWFPDFGIDPADYGRRAPPPRLKPRRTTPKEAVLPETAKPQGPLVIAVSIARQHVKVFDSNGLFAESPVSTGMRGHSTPMGVFSIIQKHKWHRSNIYSGAPMPYMQRVTWSGVAMHAGVLPGYPASHGCIRMPTTFAQKMWGWTKMGARVVIVPGDVTLESIAHPLLASLKPAPVAAAAPMTRTADAAASVPATVMSEAAAVAKAEPPAPAAVPTADTAGTAAPEPVNAEAATAGKPADVVTEAVVPKTEDKVAETVAVPPPAPTAEPAKTEPAAPVVAATPKPDATKTEPAKPDLKIVSPDAIPPTPAKRSGPIALFVSKKDGKLYVRQNFAPLFDVPVTISGDRPLGTHVFTARVDKDAAPQWTVVSLPISARAAAPAIEAAHSRTNRNKRAVAAIAPIPVPHGDVPAAALDRVQIAPEVLARLGDLVTTASSLVVSDQGIAQGETGEGTDFIVRLR